MHDAHPDNVEALSSYAEALTEADRFVEATRVYERIASLCAQGAPLARMPLAAGAPLREGGRVAEAIAFYEQNLAARPEPVRACELCVHADQGGSPARGPGAL